MQNVHGIEISVDLCDQKNKNPNKKSQREVSVFFVEIPGQEKENKNFVRVMKANKSTSIFLAFLESFEFSLIARLFAIFQFIYFFFFFQNTDLKFYAYVERICCKIEKYTHTHISFNCCIH